MVQDFFYLDLLYLHTNVVTRITGRPVYDTWTSFLESIVAHVDWIIWIALTWFQLWYNLLGKKFLYWISKLEIDDTNA